MGSGSNGNNADRARGAGGEADLGKRDGGADDNGRAGTRDFDALGIGARHNSRGINDDCRVNRGDRGRGSSDSDISGHGGTSGDLRVAGCPRSADTLEENDSLGDDLVGLTVGVNALEDVLDEDRVGAVAPGVRVVRAADAEQEGVQASRDNVGARKSLDGRVGGR